MPRYFFDVHDGIDIKDEAGLVLADYNAARDYALRTAVVFASDPKTIGENGGAIVVVVRDEAGATLLTARLVLSIYAEPSSATGETAAPADSE